MTAERPTDTKGEATGANDAEATVKPQGDAGSAQERPEGKRATEKGDHGEKAEAQKKHDRGQTEPPKGAKAERTDKDGITRIESRGKGRMVEPTLDAIDQLDCDSLVLHLSSDLRPLAGAASYVDWRLCGRLSELIERGVITGARGEKVLVPTNGRIRPVRIFVFGWGPQKQLPDGAIDRFKSAVDVLTKARAEKVAVALPEPAARIVGLVEEHIVKPLGDRLVCVFAPDGVLGEKKDITRPIPAPSPAS